MKISVFLRRLSVKYGIQDTGFGRNTLTQDPKTMVSSLIPDHSKLSKTFSLGLAAFTK